MQKSEFPKMRHYVGFWQIGSQLQCGIDWDYFVIPACCDNCELKIIKQQNIAMYGVTEPPNCNCHIFNSMHMHICGIGSVIIL